MKKALLATSVLIATIIGYAGGNIVPHEVEESGGSACSSDKVYVEEDTGLMWQDELYSDGEIGAYENGRSRGKAGKWGHAMGYCEELVYAGYADWRLPRSGELGHLHEKSHVLTYSKTADFWTSTPARGNKYISIYSVDGHVYEHSKGDSQYIRCVRCLGDSNRQ